MNAVDLIILGVLVLVALAGLRSGFLKPASGIGGLVLGVVVAMNRYSDVAELLAEQIDGEAVQRIAAFAAIVLGVVIASRLAAALLKSLLSALALGWLDHILGAAAGMLLAVVLSGTAIYVLTGADFAPTRSALGKSSLAPQVSRASLLSTDTPWCSSLDRGADNAEPCTDLKGFFNQLTGGQLPESLSGLVDGDSHGVVDAVRGALGRQPADLSGVVDGDVGGIAEALVGAPGQQPRE